MRVQICGHTDPVPVVIPIIKPPTCKKRVKSRAMAVTFAAIVRYETKTRREARIKREAARLARLGE